jgi:hypothetical protein
MQETSRSWALSAMCFCWFRVLGFLILRVEAEGASRTELLSTINHCENLSSELLYFILTIAYTGTRFYIIIENCSSHFIPSSSNCGLLNCDTK